MSGVSLWQAWRSELQGYLLQWGATEGEPGNDQVEPIFGLVIYTND